MGSPAAKELLPDPTGRPMILRPLLLARERGWKALVITRSKKKELIEYLDGLAAQGFPIQTQLIEPTTDWPHTLLCSEPHWAATNLVLLPDTEWDPPSVLDEMAEALSQVEVVFATHEVADLSTWGVMKNDLENLRLCEKPPLPNAGAAWGLYGFQRQTGRQVLEAQSRSTLDHHWEELRVSSRRFSLHRFRDFTRP